MQHMSNEQKLEHWFHYHAPTADTLPKYQAIRDAAHEFAKVLCANTPSCADQTVALRKVREAAMVANQAVACDGI